MNISRKIIALVLCLMLAFTAFTGCANTNSNEPTVEPDVTTAKATTEEVTTASEVTTEDTTTTPETTISETATEVEETTTEAATTTEPTTAATTTEATATEPEWVIEPCNEVRYATADLNVRATPEQSGERISHVDKGDEVTVTGWVDNGWARIKFRDGEYYVNGKYLAAEKPIVTTAATTEATTVKTQATTVTTENPKKTYDFSKSKYDMSTALNETPLKELAKNYFRMGVGLTGNGIYTAAVNSAEYMAVVDTHFNSVSLTNLMKPTFLLDKNGCLRNARNGKDGEVAVTFNTVDPTLKWCYENGMQMRGHTLVWHAQTPEWFFREDYDENKDYVDAKTMEARLDSYIKQVVTYIQETYPGVMYCYDVVNEAVEPAACSGKFGIRTKHGDNMSQDNGWFKTLGEDYVELAFKYARKYCDPDIKLFYNDYNTFQSQKRDYIYALTKDLQSKGLIDGIGMQGYWAATGSWFSINDVENAMKKFGSLGLEIHVTELSLHCDNDQLTDANLKKQADLYEQYFKLFAKLDTDGGGSVNLTGVTIFGLMDGFVFYDNDKTTYTLFDTNFQPKPNFYSVQKVLKSLK